MPNSTGDSNNSAVYVSKMGALIASYHHEVVLPEPALKFIENFDANRDTEPFEFTLDIPELYLLKV